MRRFFSLKYSTSGCCCRLQPDAADCTSSLWSFKLFFPEIPMDCLDTRPRLCASSPNLNPMQTPFYPNYRFPPHPPVRRARIRDLFQPLFLSSPRFVLFCGTVFCNPRSFLPYTPSSWLPSGPMRSHDLPLLFLLLLSAGLIATHVPWLVSLFFFHLNPRYPFFPLATRTYHFRQSMALRRFILDHP